MKIQLTIFALTGLDGQNGQAARHLAARELVLKSELALVCKIFFKKISFQLNRNFKKDLVKYDIMNL